jgi:DNA phosphorothioation-dependent restriction protein DptH
MATLPIGIEKKNKVIYWPYNSNEVENRNCLYVGPSGIGKTYCMERNILEAYEEGISTFIIDYSNGFSDDKLESEFKICLKSDLTRIRVYDKGIGINPFSRHLVDPSIGDYLEKPSDTADRVVDILSRIFRLGNQQKAMAYQCIHKGVGRPERNLNYGNSYYNELTLTTYGAHMDFYLLQYLLEEVNNPAALGVSTKLSSMIDKNIFCKDSFDWGQVIYGKPTVTIIDLNGFSSDIQKLITELLLWDLWYFTRAHGDKCKPFIAVFDECQNLNHSKCSPIAKILTEGRKFGWSAWMATQFLSGQFDDDELNRLLQASLKFYFKPVPNDIKLISRSICGDPMIYNVILQQLIKGRCLVNGTIQTAMGNIHNNVAVSMKIPSIGERIDRFVNLH